MNDYSIEPKTVNGQITLRTKHYRSKLMRICKGLFNITAPDKWDKNYILNNLVNVGYFGVVNTEQYGLLPLYSNPNGVNFFYAPTGLVTSAINIDIDEYTIGKDCEFFFLDRGFDLVYFNYRALCDYYAELFASADCCISVNLITSMAGWFAEADSEAQAKTIKDAFSKITSGEPLVVGRKETISPNGLNLFFNNLKQNYIADDIILTKKNLMNAFLTDIGVMNANTDKKERLITQEVESINSELEVNIASIRTNMSQCMEKIYKTFPELQGAFNIEFNNFVGDERYEIQ